MALWSDSRPPHHRGAAHPPPALPFSFSPPPSPRSPPPHSAAHLMTRTHFPVVLIHGMFGYGRQLPFWGRGTPYWPQHALDALDANYLIVDVGTISSDHDRACEAFYQLYGGRVDYGEAHARENGHDRYGTTFDKPLHPEWSESNPVHLLGHSVGATTAIELHQLICQDYFGVGSNHKWVRSIVSIAGPLSGTTLTHYLDIYDAKIQPLTLGHLVSTSLGVWFWLQTRFPSLRDVFDHRMPQWEFTVTSLWRFFSPTNPVLLSPDLAVYDVVPARRLKRNSRLVHMDKPFLVSVVTTSTSQVPRKQLTMAAAVVVLVLTTAVSWYRLRAPKVSLACGLAALSAWLRLRKRVMLPLLQWRMRRCVQKLHAGFEGFVSSDWEHNDGAVNTVSMTCPQALPPSAKESGEDDSDGSDVSTASSSGSTSSGLTPVASAETRQLRVTQDGLFSLEQEFQPGHWHVHHVKGHHKAGTNFDRASPALYRRLLTLIATEFER